MLKSLNESVKRFLFLEDDNSRRNIKKERRQDLSLEEARVYNYNLY